MGSARRSVFLMAVCLLGGTTGPLWGQAHLKPTPYCGTVYDWQGRPVAGAEVLCAEKVYDIAGGRITWGTPTRTSTDRNGRFAVQMKVEHVDSVWAVAWKEGFSLGWQPTLWTCVGEDMPIQLGRPTVLAGVVLDESCKPIADATIRPLLRNQWMRASNEGCFDEPREWLTARTDDQGRFRFDHIPDYASADLRVEAPGFASTSTCWVATPIAGSQFAAGRTDIRVVLKPEAIVRGRIVDEETGQGIAGVTLLARPNTDGGAYHCAAPVTSGSDGAFVYRGLSANDYSLQIVAPRDRPAEWTAPDVKVTAIAGRTVNANVPVGKGGLIEVTVLDLETGKPIENTKVTVTQRAAFCKYVGWYNRVYTNAQGLARLRAPVGECRLWEASADDYQYYEDPQAMTISGNEVVQRVVKLQAHPAVTGVVHDPDGRPAAGATVFGRHAGGGPVRTDEQGRFRLVVSDRRGIKGLVLLARDTSRNLATLMELKDESMPVDIRLAPAVVVRGRIVDPNDKGIAGAPVSLVASYPAEEVAPTVFTDADGAYVIPSVPAPSEDAAYWIHAGGRGYGPVSAREPSVNTPQNGQVKLDPIVLTPTDKSVSGIVVDANGVPAAYASVFVGGSSSDTEHQPEHTTVADEKGRFSFDGVCAGVLRLQVSNWSDSPQGHGTCYAHGGDRSVKVFLGRNEVGREPEPLLDKPLPDIKTVLGAGDPNQVQDKPMLICFIDMQQRPSRNTVVQLSKQVEPLRQKGIVVTMVQTVPVDDTALKAWAKEANVPCPVTMMQADEDKLRRAWGVQGLPWLVLADKNHLVRAEGFGVDEIESRLASLADTRK